MRSELALPVSSQLPESKEQAGLIRRRLSSMMSLKIQQPTISSSSSWVFRRSKSDSSMAMPESGSCIRKWWDWGWSWILSRKPTFATDLEMKEEQTPVLSCHNNKGRSWRHAFYKVRSDLRRMLLGSDKVGLPQTFRYDSFNYSQNFDHGRRTS